MRERGQSANSICCQRETTTPSRQKPMQATRILQGICVWCTGAVWHTVSVVLCAPVKAGCDAFLCCLDGVLLMLGHARVHV